MWVYQEQQAVENSPAARPEVHTPPLQPAVPQTSPPPAKAAQPDRSHKGGQATRDCALLAAAYLLGTAAAGALQALCDAGGQEALGYYLQCWCRLFAFEETKGIAVLFGTEYLAAAAAATVLLLLGLSAFGPTGIFFFMMLYGTGTGLLSAQLFAGLTPKTFAACLLVAGVPLAVTAGGLCVFGSSALQVCSRLQAFSFSRRNTLPQGAGARVLLGQYALLIVSFAPLCGAATGLAYLANQAKLW